MSPSATKRACDETDHGHGPHESNYIRNEDGTRRLHEQKIREK